MTYVEALKFVFPLLNGRDLASCMCVCRQWRDISRDNYFWKALCAKSWPSICKRPAPLTLSYHKLFQMFSKCYNGQNFLSSRLSFDDLEFYIDVWVKVRQQKRERKKRGICAEERLIFSEVIPGSVLQGGIKQLPPEIYELVESHLLEYQDEYKVIIPVEPKFGIPYPDSGKISVSVVVGRRDVNKVACIIKKTVMNIFHERCQFADASNYLDFSSRFYPFKYPIRPRVYLLYMVTKLLGDIDVHGIGLAFDIVPDSEDDDLCKSEEDVLWLLGEPLEYSITYELARMVVYVEALNVVFPLLNARDLVSCMLVCKQWRDIAANDYFWKALCTKQCPSISKRSTSFPISYHRLFHMLSKCHRRQNSLSPRLNGLSFDDFEFYIYVWAEKQVVFSEIIPCSVLRDVPKKHSLDIHERLMWRRAGKFTKVIRVEPKFSINQPKSHDVSVSVLVGRRDTNNMACLVKKTGLWPSNVSKDPAYASEYIQFIPYGDRFNSSIHPLVTLLSMVNLDVFAIELDFYLFYYYGEVQKCEDKDKDEYDDEDDNDDEEEDEDVDVNFEGGFRWILEDEDEDEDVVEVEVEDKDEDEDEDADADADAGVNFEEEFLRLVDVLDWF